MDTQYLQTQSWMFALTPEERSLVELSLALYGRESVLKIEQAGSALADYSFLVFPAAKAYEGFLKRLLYEWGLIDKQTFEGKRFRVGRALNPDVRPDQRDELWLFDDLERRCGIQTARQLWDAWLDCRNQVFHYFPKKPVFLTLEQARISLEELVAAMEAALVCKKVLHS